MLGDIIFEMPCPKCGRTIEFINEKILRVKFRPFGLEFIKLDSDFYTTDGCENMNCDWNKVELKDKNENS